MQAQAKIPGETAKQLGVAHVLEGSVQKAADNVRVRVQLINAASATHLWAESYDRKLTDIFAVESEIATKGGPVHCEPSLTRPGQNALSSRPTEDTEAYQLYLLGRYFWNKRTAADFEKAIEYFNQAIEKDPNYALAYAGLAGRLCFAQRLRRRQSRGYFSEGQGRRNESARTRPHFGRRRTPRLAWRSSPTISILPKRGGANFNARLS